MQLTRTNAVSAELPWCLLFVQKSQLSENARIFIGINITHRKTHGAERGHGVAARGSHTVAGRGQGWARAQLGCGHFGQPPTLPFGLLKPLDLIFDGGSTIFRETHLRSAADATIQKFTKHLNFRIVRSQFQNDTTGYCCQSQPKQKFALSKQVFHLLKPSQLSKVT